MARLTNADLHNEIQLLKQDLDHVKSGQLKMQSDLSMIKKTLLDPDAGAIARVNRNTQFRKTAGGYFQALLFLVCKHLALAINCLSVGSLDLLILT